MKIQRFLFILNIFIGLAGLMGGFLAISSDARLAFGIKESMLVNSPFATFLIPGLLLLIIGLCNLIVARLNAKKTSTFPYYECLMGIIQCSWIIIQCIMIWSIAPLHLIFFSLGLIQLIVGIWLVKKTNSSFPFSAHQNE
ncbi:hypothetical protein [Enterococcus rivorum]|uniref:hypothetical protein n=1 Tax=Enterococcus rivorum TaxID=762845 RepID=UPI0036360EE6